MKHARLLFGSVAAMALAACAAHAQDSTLTTPEGALMDSADDISYAPGELTQAQLENSNADIITGNGMNVFRRFPREITDDMVNFYVNALALRSLNPIQLTSTQQMILTGVGSMQIKLSAGQVGDRIYNLEGGYAAGTGIRFFLLRYPDADVVTQRFVEAGFDAPEFISRGDGAKQALVQDPGGFEIVILIAPGAKDHADDGVGVGIGVSDLDESRTFYREFVGLEELPVVEAPMMGTRFYPYRHGETTLMLYDVGEGTTADNGSAGIQYVVSDAPLAAARGDFRELGVQTPLNKLRGFDLITVWLSDPDGVTNYFAQVGPNSRTAQGQN
ncbi:hypothetical protein GCM10009127_25660 [Alteraurantiacibacter aestuarii]|uniref:VOC family protein n=1 Tax=Alteraurantiacibacter aestuarii TaxID=650004 RepID=UPI0031E2E071